MTRWLVVLAMTVAAALPASASAQRAWQPPQLLSENARAGAWGAHWDTALTVTSQGEAIATFRGEPDWPNTSTKLVTPNGGVQSLEYARSVELASDSLGNAYMSYVPKEGGAFQLRVRPPGGSFGAPEQIAPAEYSQGLPPRLFVTPDGDIAAVWENNYGPIHAAFRPAGGSFGPPEALGVDSGLDTWSAAYSENGDLVVAANDFVDPGPESVLAIIRTAAGDVSVKKISVGNRYAGRPGAGIDDAGRAVIAWAEKRTEDSFISGAYVAQRPSGGEFGPPTALSRAGGNGPPVQVVMGRDGVYTVSSSSRYGRRIAVGRAGEAPRHLRTYLSNESLETTRLAGSPSGNHALFGRAVAGRRPITSLRTGSANFEASQDLRTDCGQSEFTELAVSDNGHGAALILEGTRMLLVTDAPGGGSQSCLAGPTLPSWYDSDPYVPQVGTPSDGSWQADDGSGHTVCCFQPPSPPRPPAQGLSVGNPSLRRAPAGATTRRVRVIVICGRACTIDATAALGFPNKKPLAKAITERVESNGKAKLVEITLELDRADAKLVDKQLGPELAARPLVLTVAATATREGEKRKTRSVKTIINRPGSPF